MTLQELKSRVEEIQNEWIYIVYLGLPPWQTTCHYCSKWEYIYAKEIYNANLICDGCLIKNITKIQFVGDAKIYYKTA